MIDGQLWHGNGYEVEIFSTDLEQFSTITLSDISKITGLAEVKSDMVAVASHNGLFLIDKQGKYHQLITWIWTCIIIFIGQINACHQ